VQFTIYGKESRRLIKGWLGVLGGQQLSDFEMEMRYFSTITIFSAQPELLPSYEPSSRTT
jgi:hypothetical protein